MKESASTKKRILVTFGYHRKELFARQVGLEFKKLNLEDTIVMSLKGVEYPPTNYDDPLWIFKQNKKDYEDWKKGKIVYPEDLAPLRRKVGAAYGIDLHDNAQCREYVLKKLQKYPWLYRRIEKYDLVAHMGFRRAIKLLTSFMDKWNKEHGYECDGLGCDCYFETYHTRRSCRANIIALEYCKAFPGVTVDEALTFLKELVGYLQSNG